MKDPEQFEAELDRPMSGIVTARDLEADGESFVAFAAAFGVTADALDSAAAQLPSAPSP